MSSETSEVQFMPDQRDYLFLFGLFSGGGWALVALGLTQVTLGVVPAEQLLTLGSVTAIAAILLLGRIDDNGEGENQSLGAFSDE